MTPKPEDIQEVLSRAAELARITGHSFGSQTITLDTSGISAWTSARVATLCCAFMVGLSIGLIAMFVVASNERAELRSADSDFRDYISAIYQIAPELQKRMLEESKKDDQKTRE